MDNNDENMELIPEENAENEAVVKTRNKWTKEKTIISVLAFLVVAMAVFNALFLSGVIKLRKDSPTEVVAEAETSATGESTTVENIDDESTTVENITDESTAVETESDVDTEENTDEEVTEPEMTVAPTEVPTTKAPDTQPAQTQPASESSTKPSASNAGYKADFTVVNSWEENGKNCYQLSGTVTNTSSVGITSWSVSKELGSGAEIKSFWNCSCTLSGSNLIIKPAEYNGAIGAGASASDIGLIVASSNTLTAFSYSGNTTAVASGSGNGSQDSGQGGTSQTGGDSTADVKPYTPPKLESGTPVGNHGQLSVKGTDLVDKNGTKYQLKGVSTHGLQWFPQYVNKDAFKTLRDNWGANVIRLAMYTDEGGYCSGGSKLDLETMVCTGVEACTELGMYVIIDWHILRDSNPNTYKADAIAFFDKMSKKYSKNVNVIYEICNEPNGGVDWNTVKQYADEVIPVIRANAPNAIILVGTPTWSQDVDAVAANPVASPKNVMYTLHFYAATHMDNIRDKLKTAVAAGTPVFISEFSICDASGAGGIDYNSASTWKELINSYNISYVGWSLCNKQETSALILPGCDKTSGWSTEDLSETGKWLRNFIAGK